jgi:pilus assembly protein CpaF
MTAFTPLVPEAVATFQAPRRSPGAALAPSIPQAPPVVSAAVSRTSDLSGIGAISPLLADPTVTDVLVNGGEVWVDRGDGLVRHPATIGSPAEVRRLAQRLASACGRRLDEASPYVDAHLPDGTRVHAVLPPVATRGPYLSLRTFRRRAFRLDELVGCGSVSPLGAELLAAVVAARLSYLVTGGTGSGKTTVLTSMLGLVPHDERVVIVEDAPEIHPDHPHVVGLAARTANVEGAGTVTVRDLVRQALRMRPDRLVIGECRGAEVIDLLGALNTGHEGGAGTLHANTADDVPARLEALGLLSGVPRVALQAQIAAGIQVVIHLRRTPAGRLLDEIVVLRPAGSVGAIETVSAWHRHGGMRPGAVALANLLSERGHRPPAGLLAGRS